MKRFFFIIIFWFCLSHTLLAQGEIDEQNTLFYRNEKSGSVSLTSTGWGINGRFAKRITAADKYLYDIDFSIIRHPKEVKMPTSYIYSSNSFIFGKLNVVFDFRFGYGKQKEIFRKFDVGGISIRRFYSFGPSLALLKPIYFEVYKYLGGFNYQLLYYRQYSDELIKSLQDSISMSKASFFRGFSEIKPVPGVFFKYGFCFEYSKQDIILHAIEAGVTVDVFSKKLEIMATKENYQFFISLFATYRFGKVYDPNERKKKKARGESKEDYLY
jgi:hypothetical protein